MPMKFKKAIESVPAIAVGFRNGLQALESKDKKHVACDDSFTLTGSVYLDELLRDDYPSDSRWDYGIGVGIDAVDDRIVWLEIHPASTANIPEVLKKHAWLKRWLTDSATALRKMPAVYVWAASGRVAIAHHAKQVKHLAARGIVFAGSRYRIRSE